MTDQSPQEIKVIMTLEGTYNLINEELVELLKDFRELAEHRGFRIIEES